MDSDDEEVELKQIVKKAAHKRTGSQFPPNLNQMMPKPAELNLEEIQ